MAFRWKNTGCLLSRFDLYAAPDGVGFILDLQADLLEHYNTRVVAPVVLARDYGGAATGLNPKVMIGEEPFVVQTHLMAAIPAVHLKSPVGSIAAQADEITSALNLLFQGH